MGSLGEVAGSWKDDKVSDAVDDFGIVAKSSVKLIKNSRGVGCEIKIVAGEEHLIEGLKNEVVRIYRELEKEFVVIEKEVVGE